MYSFKKFFIFFGFSYLFVETSARIIVISDYIIVTRTKSIDFEF